MTANEGYDVLRLIQHNQSCYLSSDYVKGKTAVHWMKYHPNISKEQLFLWMQDIIQKLDQFHKVKGSPCYQYVNPYSIIITEEKEICFLDMGAQSNQVYLRNMQRRSVREYFLPPEEPYYQRASKELDIYGLGRTLQYFLSVSEPEPALTKKEEIKLQKIISRCLNRQSKKSYKNIQDIRKHFPVYKAKVNKKDDGQGRRYKRTGAIIFLILVLAAMILFFSGLTEEPDKSAQIPDENKEDIKETKEKEDGHGEEEARLKFDMGMVYFLDLEAYGKSREYFQDAGDSMEAAKAYKTIADFLADGENKNGTQELKKALEDAEKAVGDTKDERYYRGLMRGYSMIDDAEAYESIIRLGKKCLALDGWKLADTDKKIEKELVSQMAVAYEETGENELAAETYESQLGLEEDKRTKEVIYKKITILWEKEQQKEKALECLRKGIDELADAEELRVLYIEMQCKDPSVDRNICAQTIQTYITEMPQIIENEEFQKLTREYEIRVEGEQVWVGS